MSIQFACPSCRTKLKVSDAAAGKVGKCKACGASAVVPSASTVASEPVRPATADATSAKPTKPIAPATERQKEYARSLAVTFPDDINIRDISILIDAAKEKQDEERWRSLDELSDKESAAYARIREEILEDIDADDCRLSTATPDQIAEALEERGIAAILVTYPSDCEGKETVQGGVNFTSDLSEEIVAARLFEASLLLMERTNPDLAKALKTLLDWDP